MKSFKIRRLDFSDIMLYAVSPSDLSGPQLLEKAQKILSGGADALQFRAKNLTIRESVDLGKKLKKLCDEYQALFIMNDRVDLALAVQAHGVHLGQDDLPVNEARDMMGHRNIIGVSTHSLSEALKAQKEGADYVSCGPLWATPTKPSYPAVGLNLIDFYKAALKIPFVAIGGINESNIDSVVDKSAKTIAVVRALFDSSDPEAAARLMRSKIEKNWGAPISAPLPV